MPASSQKPRRPDVIIPVMGMTGSGKSSFIKLITGDKRIKIGHGVSSETSEIGLHYWNTPDGRLGAFVDTPGFDDSNGMTDSEVLDEIASFLSDTYGEINGLIYCQRIDVRAGGLTVRNLRMFHKVCGLAIKNAVMVTTRWDVVGNERAVELEQELKTGQRYFKPLCDAGASTFGHDNTYESAQRVMYNLLKYNPIPLRLQIELREGKTLDQTEAGTQLSADLDALIKKHEAEMKKVREEFEEALDAKDEAWQKLLNDELAKLREDIARSNQGKENLKKRPSKPKLFEALISTVSFIGGLGGAFIAGALRGFRS